MDDIKMLTNEDIEALITLALIFGGGLLAIVGSLFTFGFWPTVMVLGVLAFRTGRVLL